MKTPQPQKNLLFSDTSNFAEILKFLKKLFFGGAEGGVWVSNHPKWFYISVFMIFGGLEAKKGLFKKIQYLKDVIF